MKNKFYYIGLNFVAPGIGQLSAKRYIRGAIQLVGAIGAIVLACRRGDIAIYKILQRQHA